MPEKDTIPRIDLGIRAQSTPKGLKLTEVLHNGPCEQAGLSPGDLLIALDGLQVDQSSFPSRLEQFDAGETVSAVVFRDDQLREFKVTLAEAKRDTCVLSLNDSSDKKALRLRKAWLGK